jgi:hypothetical protein
MVSRVLESIMLDISKDPPHLLLLVELVLPLRELGESRIIKLARVEEASFIIRVIELAHGLNLEEQATRVLTEARVGIWKEVMEVQESQSLILNYQEG